MDSRCVFEEEKARESGEKESTVNKLMRNSVLRTFNSYCIRSTVNLQNRDSRFGLISPSTKGGEARWLEIRFCRSGSGWEGKMNFNSAELFDRFLSPDIFGFINRRMKKVWEILEKPADQLMSLSQKNLHKKIPLHSVSAKSARLRKKEPKTLFFFDTKAGKLENCLHLGAVCSSQGYDLSSRHGRKKRARRGEKLELCHEDFSASTSQLQRRMFADGERAITGKTSQALNLFNLQKLKSLADCSLRNLLSFLVVCSHSPRVRHKNHSLPRDYFEMKNEWTAKKSVCKAKTVTQVIFLILFANAWCEKNNESRKNFSLSHRFVLDSFAFFPAKCT